MMLRVGVDIGGSGVKAAVVDVASGQLVTDRVRIETPDGFGFDDVVSTAAAAVRALDHDGPIGVGFPGVVVRGVVKSPPTAHEYAGWVGRDVAAAISAAVGRAALVINDADAAGTAEHAFGAGQGQEGVVLVFTLGTGVGSAMFIDDVLVPNTELGKLFLAGENAVSENQVASRVRTEEGLSWEVWGQRLHEYFAHVERLFSPDLIIVGGGVSRRYQKYLHLIDIDTEIVPAQLRNHAGIVGAAVAAAGA